MTSVTASEARTHLPALLDRVEAGEQISITRHGRTVAVVAPPASIRNPRAAAAYAAADELERALEKARSEPLPDDGWLTSAQAEELVAEVRAGRDSR